MFLKLFANLRMVWLRLKNAVRLINIEFSFGFFWMVVPCILFEIRIIYQLDALFVYFSSTSFGLTRPSSGPIEL